ncbi:unnamed protein product [Darwinula stevensoni]|uniref:Heparan-alpha-glucosaminide N-acetyltransferase catalytic domain-containing protein n=1 Tax=Darwinula stevensoni TaxID=69355 RepID=A0A7R9A8N8_9CRUS|nr:unnamed protein product [Darwinula stevensoni]CAG0896559.1 unnamed protein product [Darwinula stevensoni]
MTEQDGEIFCKMKHNRSLQLNEACLKLTLEDKADQVYSVFAQSVECEGCDPWYFGNVESGKGTELVVNTSYGTWVGIQDANNKNVCNVTYHFTEFGVYKLGFNHTDCSPIQVLIQPPNPFLPLLWAFFLLLGIQALLPFVTQKNLRRVKRLLTRREDPLLEDLGSPEHHTPSSSFSIQASPKGKERLNSLDTFRGIAIVLMIFVNYGGGDYWFFKHSRWNGLTVADLPFPWFMWIMGVSLVLSLKSQLMKSFSRKQIFIRILRRSTILFLLGLILNARSTNRLTDMRLLRIPGVLQRFSIVYFLVATQELFLFKLPDVSQQGLARLGRNCCHIIRGLFFALCITSHLLITFHLPVPSCPRGYLGPGGMHDGGGFWNCTGGAIGYVDRLVFGESHIYQHATPKSLYNTNIPFDPEGLVGTLNSIVLVYLGVVAGLIVVTHPVARLHILMWLILGFLTGMVGLGLCEASQNGGVIPLNKNLWSLSYTLVTAGTSFFILALLHWIVDIQQWWRGAPFSHVGMNAILLYVGHELLEKTFPVQFGPLPESHLARLFMNLWGTIFWILVAVWLHSHRFFLAL